MTTFLPTMGTQELVELRMLRRGQPLHEAAAEPESQLEVPGYLLFALGRYLPVHHLVQHGAGDYMAQIATLYCGGNHFAAGGVDKYIGLFPLDQLGGNPDAQLHLHRQLLELGH